MLNQLILVGRLTENPKEIINNKLIVTLAVQRNYKNLDGVYETDFINVVLWQGVAENTYEYCKKGDLIGIRGRLETELVNNQRLLLVVADRVSFLSSRKEKDNDMC